VPKKLAAALALQDGALDKISAYGIPLHANSLRDAVDMLERGLNLLVENDADDEPVPEIATFYAVLVQTSRQLFQQTHNISDLDDGIRYAQQGLDTTLNDDHLKNLRKGILLMETND
jgi:hypothetical protein